MALVLPVVTASISGIGSRPDTGLGSKRRRGVFMLRGIALEFRGHVDSPAWTPVWDVVFSLSSLLLVPNVTRRTRLPRW